MDTILQKQAGFVDNVATDEETQLICLVAALTRLMTYYATRPNTGNARSVVRVLKELTRHSEVRDQPLLLDTYSRMLPHWQSLAVSQQQSPFNAITSTGRLH